MQDASQKAATAPAPRAGGRSYVLRFISGKYQGGEFPVAPEKQILIGRSSDLDMVLVEDMVSRKHARITMQSDQIWIEDLGSTNGTFVNGEKIKRAHLKEGDRVLIGTSILKLIAGDAPREGLDAKRELENVAQARRTSQQLNELDDVQPLKSLYRMLTWQKGLFDLDPAEDREFPAGEVNLSVQEILIEGMRQLDEFNRIRGELPELGAHIVIHAPLIPPLRDLKREELDVLQLAHNYGTFEAVLNKSLATDLQTAEIVLKLLTASYLRVD